MGSSRLSVLALLFGLAACKGNDSGLTGSKVCDDYLSCLSTVQPEAFAAAMSVYEKDGACWQSDSGRQSCETACSQSLNQLASLYPHEAACGWTAEGGNQTTFYAPLFTDKDVDLLFMIDNSNSMDAEQTLLGKQFPKLIEALRSPHLGPTGCTTNCYIPNVHIGIVTSDLGADSYDLPSCETPGGDGGKLVHEPLVKTGCATPTDKWISFQDGVSNVDNSSSTDEVDKVKDAFSCLAEVGTGGCGFEHQLESAKKALDSSVNPGFLRNDPKNNKDALLVVVLVTDEDDCSASNTQLFDPSQTGLTDTLGPLTSFRCFEFGVTCDVNDRNTMGTRTNCVAKTGSDAKYLYDPLRYIDFFKSVKKGPTGEAAPNRVLVVAITGPSSPVEVGSDGQYPELEPACKSSLGEAAPAIRINYVLDGLGEQGQFSSICNGDFSSAFQKLAAFIATSIATTCLKAPVLTASNGVVCKAGDALSSTDASKSCDSSCLDQAACTVEEVSASTGESEQVQQCPQEIFDSTETSPSCGATCPCWRVVKSSSCKPESGSSPYALEVLQNGNAPKGTYAKISCLTTPYSWGDDDFATLSQCAR